MKISSIVLALALTCGAFSMQLAKAVDGLSTIQDRKNKTQI